MSKKKQIDIKREYDICRCLITNIQSITRHKTHDIIAFMDGIAQQCLKSNGLDFATVPKRDKYGDFDSADRYLSVQDYAYYPDTKVYLGVSICREVSGQYDEPYILVKYKFYTPSTFKKLNEKEFDEMIIDAMLTDTSLDFDPPNVKKKKTLLEKEQEEKEREEKYNKQLIKEKLKELKVLLKRGLTLHNTAVANSNWSQRDLNIAINKNTRQIEQTINYLKHLGDKTHEVLFTPTDSNII